MVGTFSHFLTAIIIVALIELVEILSFSFIHVAEIEIRTELFHLLIKSLEMPIKDLLKQLVGKYT